MNLFADLRKFCCDSLTKGLSPCVFCINIKFLKKEEKNANL